MKHLAWLLVVASCAPLRPQPSAATDLRPRAAEGARVAGPPRELPGDQRRYLEEIYRRLRVGWDDALANAAAFYPAADPVNDPSLMAEVELTLGASGQPAAMRLVSRSRSHRFDNSALLVVSWLRGLPPLPVSLPEGHVRLRWRFHRDARGCAPTYAALQVQPLPLAQALERAMDGARWPEASRILAEQPGLARQVIERGLVSGERTRHLALAALPTDRLAALLGRERTAGFWSVGIAVLEARRERAALLALVERLAPATPGFGKEAEITEATAPLLAWLLLACSRLGLEVPEASLRRALEQAPDPVLAAAAIPALRSSALAAREWPRWAGEPLVGPPLAAIVCSGAGAQRQASAPCPGWAERAVQAALEGTEPAPVLAALSRWPVPRFRATLLQLAASRRLAAPSRVAAVQAGARVAGPLQPLLALLRADELEVQIAAARALAASGERRRVAYRLLTLVQESRGRLAAEALGAAASLGMPELLPDLLYRAARLPAAARAPLVRELWRYGDAALTWLRRALAAPEPELRTAAQASLARLGGEAGRPAAAPRDELTAAPVEARSFEELLRQAAQLASPAAEATASSRLER